GPCFQKILRDDRKETLKRCLEDLKGKGMKVQACVVDMRETFRKVVQEVFPEAELILDPFHLIQDANRRLDEARKIERKEEETHSPSPPPQGKGKPHSRAEGGS
ncbi:MAG: transposase, partial [Candidatus Hadarchaeales archaeon]